MEIRKAGPDDVRAILELMREFAEYEKLAEFMETTEERLAEAMFGERAFVEGLLALDDGRTVAYSLFYPCFASFRGQLGFYIEDIFVSEAGRRKGIGEALLREIARLGKSRGIERIDFQVLEWNTPAVRFYESLGALRDNEERHFKFTDAAFWKLAE